MTSFRTMHYTPASICRLTKTPGNITIKTSSKDQNVDSIEDIDNITQMTVHPQPIHPEHHLS